MVEFDYNFVSILFGVAGTFILFFSNILSYRNNVKNKEKFSLVSQLIGFLFLFNSFLYLLWPRINELNIISVYPPIMEFSYWPYYCFIITGMFISLVIVKEKNFGYGLEVSISPENKFEQYIFYSPVIFAVAGIFNQDFLLISNTIIWIYLVSMLLERS